MRVLILGGTGLISTGITRQLLELGHDVHHYNRGLTESPLATDVPTTHADRADSLALRTAAQGADAIIDMICFRPSEAEAAVTAFAGMDVHYVMCSTVDVFTRPARRYPVVETDDREPSPNYNYAHDKEICERLLRAAHDRGELNLTVLRPAATYVDSAVPSIGTFDLALERLLRRQPVVVHGEGTSIWTACHRDDVASAFVSSLCRSDLFGRSYNVPGTELLTWDSYWETVASVLGMPIDILHVPTDLIWTWDPSYAFLCRENFQYNNIFSAAAAEQDLGFRYTINWEEGIAEGLAGRTPRSVDELERARYDQIVQAWRTVSADSRQRIPRAQVTR